VNGPYGIRDVCISVPTVVGRNGVEAQLEIELWAKEVSALQQSANVLRETIDLVRKSNPNAAGKATGKTAAPSTASAQGGSKPVRVTMGAGGGGNYGGGSSRVTISGLGNGNGPGGR
jgi:L-lactate dehydrogenase